MNRVASLLAQGVRHQQAGQWAEAERHYLAVLQAEPENADALHLLGTIALAANRPDLAIQYISEAIRRDRTQPAFHANLAEAYRAGGQLEHAIASNRAALKLRPDFLDAQMNLALALYQQGQHAEAAEYCRRIVRVRAEHAMARSLLGVVLREQGKIDESEACFRRALSTAPSDANLHAQLGLTCYAAQRYADARGAFEAAAALAPNDANIHNNLANTLKELGELELAERHYRRAIELAPGLASAHSNLGVMLAASRRDEEALSLLKRATVLAPNFAQAFVNLASVLRNTGRPDEGAEAARRAIELAPGLSVAHSLLGSCLRALGQADDAIRSFRDAVRLEPHNAWYGSNLVYALHLPAQLDAASLAAEHRQWGAIHADPLTKASPPPANDRTAERRLRIGYVSGHFRDHAVNFFVEPILAQHDHQQFEIFGYSNTASTDETTERLKGYADHWRDITRDSDSDAADRIRRDQIDVLVDLAGHIAGHRLLVFARRPAPVQVTYLGYQNTTGMAAMHYRLTDDWADPPGATERFYTEQLVRLGETFFCYHPSPRAPDVAAPPHETAGKITFGSLNNFAKLNPRVLATWAEILKRVANSHLVILADDVPFVVRYVEQVMVGRGVDPSRVRVAGRRPRPGYLELMNQIDVALDPFPFQGHTTTCDALWQGLPVVMLAGEIYVERFGSSALRTLGLHDLIANSVEDYVDRAVRLAIDQRRLVELRRTLRGRMTQSALLDFPGFTRKLEAAYREMWHRWRANESARSVEGS